MRRYPPTVTDQRVQAPRQSRPSSGFQGQVSLYSLEEELQMTGQRGCLGRRRLRVMRMQPAAENEAAELQRIQAALEDGSRQQTIQARIQGRPVLLREVGEVVQDGQGRRYQSRDGQLRPLGQLLVNDEGRFFEVREVAEGVQEPASQRASAGDGSPLVAKRNDPARVRSAGPVQTKSPARRPLLLPLVDEPGLRVQVSFGAFKAELAPQLSAPQALPDETIVECWARVYEVCASVSLERLERLLSSRLGRNVKPQRLTRERARDLGAADLAPSQKLHKDSASPQTQDHASRGERFFHLQPIFDLSLLKAPSQSEESNDRESSQTESTPKRRARPSDSRTGKGVPFCHSRQEVLYDMHSLSGTWEPRCGTLTRWLLACPIRWMRSLATVVTSGPPLRKWQAMRRGKPRQRQLWSVAPPRGFTRHPAVRRWAREMLQADSDDPEQAYREWEIHWRRRGIS